MKLITMLFLVVLAALGLWEVVRMLGDRLDSCRRRQLTLMLPLQGDERDLENILHNLKNTQEYSCFRRAGGAAVRARLCSTPAGGGQNERLQSDGEMGILYLYAMLCGRRCGRPKSHLQRSHRGRHGTTADPDLRHRRRCHL